MVHAYSRTPSAACSNFTYDDVELTVISMNYLRSELGATASRRFARGHDFSSRGRARQ